MKNFAKLSRLFGKMILPAVAAVALTACDDVSPLDRYIPLPELQNTDRTVLLEDFTGQNCVNCPAAHEIMELLSEQYGDRLVCVSIHAGQLSFPVSMTNYNLNFVGLRSEEGDAYANQAGVGHYPMGSVDFSAALDPDQWAGGVRLQLEKDPAAKIELSASLVDNKVKIKADFLPTTDFTGKYLVWILESGIVAAQQTETGMKLDYVHNNVFRASVNGTWGEDISLKEGLLSSVENEIEVRYNDKERWNKDELSIVAFIYNDKGVQQAARVDVVPAE